MKISFIIVNYQSEKYLQKCISSIKEKVLGADYEIIVVNNDSAGNAYMHSLPEGTRVINIGKNIGFGAANNIGAKKAQGKYSCFLNPDTEIISNNIERLLSEFENDEKLGTIGPKLINENGSAQEWSAGKEVTIGSIILNNLGYKRDKKIWESQEKKECAWVSGAAMFIQKELFDKLGGFDEKFFMYFEDIDLCKRARNLGYKVLYYPEFTVKHFGGKSFLDKKEQKRYFYASQDYYFEKHFSNLLSGIARFLRILQY